MLFKNKVALELERLTKLNGGSITPEIVLAAASDRKHILHKQFDWADTPAAAADRLDRARRVLRVRDGYL